MKSSSERPILYSPTSVPLAMAVLPSFRATVMGLLPTSAVKPVTDCSLPVYFSVALLPVMVTVISSVFGVISRKPSTTSTLMLE